MRDLTTFWFPYIYDLIFIWPNHKSPQSVNPMKSSSVTDRQTDKVRTVAYFFKIWKYANKQIIRNFSEIVMAFDRELKTWEETLRSGSRAQVSLLIAKLTEEVQKTPKYPDCETIFLKWSFKHGYWNFLDLNFRFLEKKLENYFESQFEKIVDQIRPDRQVQIFYSRWQNSNKIEKIVFK